MSRTTSTQAKKKASVFDPRRKGTDEAALARKFRPDLMAIKAAPSPRRDLAERLFELRMKAGLSQAALAKKAGIGVATYQRIEQCQPISNPGLDVLENLAKALKVEFVELWMKGGKGARDARN
jgi:ribosome-binding protein aMBF1 (putative translation factor)